VWGGSVTPPARLFLLHARDRINVLVVGGSSARRLQVAWAFHRRSVTRRGPFVCVDAGREEAVLRAALRSWTGCREGAGADPVAAAQHGTLYLESVSKLSAETQRLLLDFCLRHVNVPASESPRPWVGRLVAGDGLRLGRAVRDGAFSMAVFDAIDKVRVDLPSRPALVARRRPA